MAYGDRNRSVSERDVGILSILGMGISSAVGIAAAVVVDLFQHREASALYVINRWFLEVTSMLGVDSVPLYGVMLILMAIGAGSIIYFEPLTQRGAFARGFGLLAILVTLAPSDLGTPLEAPTTPAASALRVPATNASLSLTQDRAAASQRYELRIQVEFPEGLDRDWQAMIRRGTLAGKLWNPDTETRYSLFRNSGADISYDDGILRIETSIAGTAPSADLWLVVEADGYAIKESQFNARDGANPIWKVEMEPSGMPLLLLRLRHSYRF